MSLYCLIVLVIVVGVASNSQTVVNIYSSGTDKRCNDVKANQNNDDVVAFSVGTTESFKPTTDSRIPVNTVFYNKGKHFDRTKNVFVVPVNGLYSFFFSMSGDATAHTISYLYVATAGKPETPVAATYQTPKGSHAQASGSVLLELNKGDNVSWVLKAGGHIDKFSPPSTLFSGFLLK